MRARRSVAALSAGVLFATLSAGLARQAAALDPASAQPEAAIAPSDCYSQDNGDPEVAAFSITPTEVDSRAGDQTVTFKAIPRDTGGPGAPSGVARARLSIGLTPNPDNAWGPWRMHWNGHGALVLKLKFSPQDVTALWYVSLFLRDAAGNVTNYSSRDLVAAGLPSTFSSHSAAPPDEQRPAIKTVRLSASALDVSRRATLRLQVRARDDTGVAWMEAWLYGEDNLLTTRIAELRLREGSFRNGLWRGRIALRRVAGDETAHLVVELGDFRGRFRHYGPKRLEAIDQPNQVHLHGLVDTARPDVRTPVLRPVSVDLRDGSQKVTIRVRITDRGAGVRKVDADLDGSDTDLDFQGYDVDLKRVRGTDHDGIWKATVLLSRCEAEAGRWSAFVFAFDNSLPGGIASSRRITVINNDIAPPSAEVVGRTPVAGPLTIRFDENVVGVSTDNIKLYRGFWAEGRPGDGPPAIDGSWSCLDAADAPIDCLNGPVRTAAFTPTSPFLVDHPHTVILNPEHHLGLTDLAGNPPVDLFTHEVFLFNDLDFTPK